MELNFNETQIKQIRDDANLILWNSGLGNMETMKFTTQLIMRLKNAKIIID